MTIDEAINHCEEVAKDMTNVDESELDLIYSSDTECITEHMDRCIKCADEHKQLAEWLKDYKRLKEQEPKTGHWITWKEAGNEIPSETRFECSVCHDAAQTLCNGLDLLSPYCPNCGAKMESEDN